MSAHPDGPFITFYFLGKLSDQFRFLKIVYEALSKTSAFLQR